MPVALGNGGAISAAVGANLRLFSTSGQESSFTDVFGGGESGGLHSPNFLALDGLGYAWITNANNTLSRFNTTTGDPVGGSFSSTPAATGGGLGFDTTYLPVLAVDGANQVWVPNHAGKSISGFTSSGVALSPASTGITGGLSCPAKAAVPDLSGNLWVSCDSTTAPLVEFIGIASPTVAPISPANAGKLP
jgi:hypothetical protein